MVRGIGHGGPQHRGDPYRECLLDVTRWAKEGLIDLLVGDQWMSRQRTPEQLAEQVKLSVSQVAGTQVEVALEMAIFDADLGLISRGLPAVRDAFDTWAQTGIPVRFTFVIDSASADVHVRFTERFDNGISGKTIWSRDSAWWLVSSDIQLALAHPGGGSVTPPQIRAIALHEVGHLLGLDHSSAAENIMSARIRVRDLTEPDRATVRLLYSIPAGSLR